MCREDVWSLENGVWRMENGGMEKGEWRSRDYCKHDGNRRLGGTKKWINDAIVIPLLSRMLYGDGVERSV